MSRKHAALAAVDLRCDVPGCDRRAQLRHRLREIYDALVGRMPTNHVRLCSYHRRQAELSG